MAFGLGGSGGGPIRFDMGGGGKDQVPFGGAPATAASSSSMPMFDVSEGASSSSSAKMPMFDVSGEADTVSFSASGHGMAGAAAASSAAPPTPKTATLSGRVALQLIGSRSDDEFASIVSAAQGAAILDAEAFATPVVIEQASAEGVATWWAANSEALGTAAAAVTATPGFIMIARQDTSPTRAASSSSAAGATAAAVTGAGGEAGEVHVGAASALGFIKSRMGGGGALRQPSVSHAAAASADAGTFDYDLLVIGGGSGGLACAKEAAKLGANVCLCDFVKPSPQGTRWGLGGTCVNVGCIPKKLMHHAATMREEAKDLPFFGWTDAAGVGGAEPKAPELALRWKQLVSNVQDHIASLNYGYKGDLSDNSVTYRNATAKLTADPHSVELRDKQGKVTTVSAARIVVAVGGRPRSLECDGRELAISSDDIFSLEQAPGEVLIVGAGYIALETAGFLVGLGFKVTLMVRSILLRGFDRECVVMIEKDLVRRGVNILAKCTPVKIEAAAAKPAAGEAPQAADAGPGEDAPSRKRVTWCTESGTEESAEFDTVFAAIGRAPDTASLGLDAAGIKMARSGKIVCAEEQTSVPNIFAIGDVVDGKPELTPVAIQAGRLLARRLYGGSDRGFDYRCVATAVFTPLEYGTVGLSEEAATEQLGAEHVDAFLSKYKPLEWTLNYYRHEEFSFAKVVVDLRTDRVVGLHYLGPHAGEVTQGFAAAMRMGITLTALRDTVGIHPTTAEEFTSLEVSRSSGAPIEKGSC